MKSFDEFGFEKRSNTTENNNTPATDDFITRRKKGSEEAKQETREVAKVDEPSASREISVACSGNEMTVMSIKGSNNREITKPTEVKKNIFATDNVLEKKKKKFPVRAVMVFVSVFALAFLIINQYVLINEYSKGIASMQNTIKSLEADLEQCETELVVKNKNVEEYAKTHGMISDKDGQGEYVEITSQDTIEVYESEDDSSHSLASIVMSALGENILRAWNTLTGVE